MKNIRLFIISSSLVLAAWLGASYMTEVQDAPGRDNAAQDGGNTPAAAAETNPGDPADSPLPVAHIK